MVDDMFGEGIARGTVPLEHGDGVNVLIDFLGPAQDPKPPASRGAENLKAGARRPDEDDQLQYRYGLRFRCSTPSTRTQQSRAPQRRTGSPWPIFMRWDLLPPL